MQAWLEAFWTSGYGAGALLFVWGASVWLVGAVLVALAARQRGRSVVLWLVLAILQTPILAALLLLVLPDRTAQVIHRDAGKRRHGWRLCPACHEAMRQSARRCPHCTFDVELARRALPADAMVADRGERATPGGWSAAGPGGGNAGGAAGRGRNPAGPGQAGPAVQGFGRSGASDLVWTPPSDNAR